MNPYGACRDRWNALAPELKEKLFRVWQELLQHQRQGHLPEERVRQHIEFILKYVG